MFAFGLFFTSNLSIFIGLVFLKPIKYPIAIITITTITCLAMRASMVVEVKAAVSTMNWLIG